MRPKSGLPKRKPIKSSPVFEFGLKDHPDADFSVVREQPSLSVASFFCGCGGLDLGFLGGFSHLNQHYPPLPFTIEHAIDNDEKAIQTYRLNLQADAQCRDLTQVDKNNLKTCDVLTGGFPCQDFSSSGYKTGLGSERSNLYRQMVDYLTAKKPKVFVAENVKHLARMQNGAVLKKIVGDFAGCGYSVKAWTIFCPDYGLPQSRTRLFIVGVRNDIDGFPVYPPPSHVMFPVSIDQAIDDLKPIKDEQVANQSQYFVATRATSGGGQGDHTNRRGKVAYAIRANAKARIQFHYELDRRLTVRECARLRGFPDEFIFPFSAGANMMQIGNAVPPIIGHALAGAVGGFLLEAGRGKHRPQAEGRETVIDSRYIDECCT
ncbi:MAG: DNA (cytosine-5-)-methyltransferase [Gammaproteobacteria bacterium AqS3]|nr:DNA (cytosine-5-)-methyltransferase [Gammaproteobacteria bacterium AqS3]